VERLVAAHGPFRFDLALGYLASSPSTIAERVADGEYARAFRTSAGAVAVARVTEAPGGVRVRVEGSDEPAALDRAAEIARLAFGLLGDPTGLDELAAREPIVGPLLARYRGLRPLVIPDPFEALVWAILGQQINVAFAAKTKRALIHAYGEPLSDGLWLFPEPARLAAVTPEGLRRLQISRQKAVYIAGLARADVDFEALRALPDEDVVVALTRLKGIGRWTAEYLLLRGFGRRDAIPAGDMGLRIVLGRLCGLGRNASEAEVRQMAEAWAPWRGYVAFYLWFALQRRDQLPLAR
jgi:DNA-3-methyladenine glycosylase II